MQKPLELTYFPVMARGLGLALVAEHSGVSWKGTKDLGFSFEEWVKLKPTCPFGQLPICKVDDKIISQTSAILNVFARKGGTEREGHEFAMSQMLMAEAQDLYAYLDACVPSMFNSSKNPCVSASHKGMQSLAGIRTCQI